MNDERTHGPTEGELIEALASGLKEVLRVVRFSDVEEWISELRLHVATLSLPYVRCTALHRWDTQVTVLQQVTACAGFWGLAEYVELRAYCGSRMQGDTGDVHDRYTKIRHRVEEVCRELGIAVRGGYWPAGEGGGHG